MSIESIQKLQTKAETIMDNGHFMFIKFDGERANDRITIIIDYPPQLGKEMIKYEGDDLDLLIEKALKKYE